MFVWDNDGRRPAFRSEFAKMSSLLVYTEPGRKTGFFFRRYISTPGKNFYFAPSQKRLPYFIEH